MNVPFLFDNQMCAGGWVVFSHEDHAYVCLPLSLLWVLAKGNWVGVNTQDAVYPLGLLQGGHWVNIIDHLSISDHFA